jgi:hypothetical protein
MKGTPDALDMKIGCCRSSQISGRLLLGRILDLNRNISVCEIKEFVPGF